MNIRKLRSLIGLFTDELFGARSICSIDTSGHTLQYVSEGSLKIPLENGTVVKIPLSSINISEEVNKTGIWKQVNNVNTRDTEKKKSPNPVGKFKKKKHSKKEEKRDEKPKLEKRLSTMAEEEEDEGISIKSQKHKEKYYWKSQAETEDDKNVETHV